MAGKYGPASVTVTLEDGPGGTARALTNFILEGISVKQTSVLTDTTALGDSFEEQTPHRYEAYRKYYADLHLGYHRHHGYPCGVGHGG